jgi:molybdate transport system ATP-binding protein
MSSLLEARFEKRFAAGLAIEADWTAPTDRFEITVLFGPSGCGKTTTLRCLAGLERPDSGYIRYAGSAWFDAARARNLGPQERGIGFLFQDYALFPHLSVEKNIAYGLHEAPAKEKSARVGEIVEMFDLRGLEQRRPRQLSGGQQQRVALARTLVTRPRLLLLDEPLSALDDQTREGIRSKLRPLLAKFAVPVLLVTHDRVEAMSLGDRIIVLDQGRIRQQGAITDVFTHPADRATAAIVGVETVQNGRILSTENGLAVVAVGNTQLVALAPRQSVAEVSVCIRGEDVTLQKNLAGEASSARNRLPAAVVSWTLEGPLVRVELDPGFPLTALITRPSWEEMALTNGSQVLALVKTPAIHLIPRP